MIKAASSVMDGISKWMSDNPTTTTALLTGGAGALGGLALTNTDPDEDASTSMKRRLKNALIVGGLGAGVGALGSEAIKAFDSALPDPEPTVMDKVAPWLDSAGGAAIGTYGGGILGQKIMNSNLPKIGQGAETLDLAKELTGREIKNVSEARAAIMRAAKGDNEISELARALGKNADNEIHTVRGIAEVLGKLNIKPDKVANPRLAKFLAKVKPTGRLGVIGTLATLGLAGGAVGGKKIGDLIHSKD